MASVIHIVDDDASVRAGLSFLLRSQGHATQIYASGSEFLQGARLEGGCILLDLRMPDLDGFGVQAALARRGGKLPVIMMTGHGDIPSAVRAVKLGAFDFLEKPFEKDALLQTVEQALTVAHAERRGRARRNEALTAIGKLSEREIQMLRGLLAGMTNKEIARRFDISPRTVEMHRANIMRDMDCHTLADVIRIGIEAELEPLARDDAQPEFGVAPASDAVA